LQPGGLVKVTCSNIQKRPFDGIMSLSPANIQSVAFLKDVSERAAAAAGEDAQIIQLAAGEPLFLAGSQADRIYFVVSGALGAFKPVNGTNEFVAHVRSGEPAGEMALFLGGIDLNGDGAPDDAPHSSSVYALRDSEILSISRDGFNRLVDEEPQILQAMTRLILRRLGRQGARHARTAPKVFTLLATSPTIDLRFRARFLRDEIRRLGKTCVIVEESEGDGKPAKFFDTLEMTHDVVILAAAIGDTPWFHLATRQADRIWVLARGDARPSSPLMPESDSPVRAMKLIDVVLLHPGAERAAARPSTWIEAADASRLFHWHGDDGAEGKRLARVMAGRSIGLILSGGGARAYAHIGVVRALREAGLPIDFVGGASMGAVIAACVAIGWDDDEIDRRIRKAFVETNPLGDYNLPVVGMVAGRRVARRLTEHFGEADIGDLRLPFFATSTNLTTGSTRVHREGRLRDVLRATISLPGILPPVVEGENVLVDGAVLNNFPAEMMRELHHGFVVGSDVSRLPKGLNANEFQDPPGFFRWVVSNGFSATPPIASLLMRTATLRSNPHAGREATDFLVLPEIGAMQLRDWTEYDSTVQAGYDAARKTLEASDLKVKTLGA
jgi:NTE family protein